MRSRYLIHYDADGGGFGAFLLSYVGANLLADAIGFELVTVNPLIRSIFELGEAPAVEKIFAASNVLRLDDLITSSSNQEISFKHLIDMLVSSNCNCLLYGRHHMPRIAVADFIDIVGCSSYVKYASSKLSRLRLVSCMQNYYLNLASSSLGIHIRTFFDSKSGNDDFRRHRSLLYGFVLELIKSNYQQESYCYLACDNDKEWQIAKQILAFNGLNTLNHFIPVKHSSLAHLLGTRLLYANRSINDDISLIVEQSNFGSLDTLREHLRPTLLDWISLGKSDTIVCTNTSFAITAALVFGSKFITFPCRSDLKNLATPLTLV